MHDFGMENQDYQKVQNPIFRDFFPCIIAPIRVPQNCSPYCLYSDDDGDDEQTWGKSNALCYFLVFIHSFPHHLPKYKLTRATLTS